MCVRCQTDDFEGGYVEGAGGVLCFNCLDDLGVQNTKFFLIENQKEEQDS